MHATFQWFTHRAAGTPAQAPADPLSVCRGTRTQLRRGGLVGLNVNTEQAFALENLSDLLERRLMLPRGYRPRRG